MSDRPYLFQEFFDTLNSTDERVIVLKDVLSQSDVPISKALRLAELMGCTLLVQLKPKPKTDKTPTAKPDTFGGAA